MSITYAQALSVLEGIVAEHPEDYTYNRRVEEVTGLPNGDTTTCMYRFVDYGVPGCIVGVALDRLGVEYNPRWEYQPFSDLVRDYGVEVETRAAVLFETAQYHQDMDATWAEALRFGVEAASEVTV
jgi:hypothetical protein